MAAPRKAFSRRQDELQTREEFWFHRPKKGGEPEHTPTLKTGVCLLLRAVDALQRSIFLTKFVLKCNNRKERLSVGGTVRRSGSGGLHLSRKICYSRRSQIQLYIKANYITLPYCSDYGALFYAEARVCFRSNIR